MNLRHLKISNFRGITELEWRPAGGLVCLVGPGDSCKSTILDAAEYALAPRWIQFTDVDFTNGDPTNPIVIEVTVGGLPAAALADNRFGLHLRGWTASGELNDEPGETDDPVVTVRLTVDASLDPSWELVNARQQPRLLTVGERRFFGVVRLGEDAEKHLAWSQGSALTRLTDAQEDAATRLAEAYRRARTLVGAQTIPGLGPIAQQVNQAARRLGAYGSPTYSPGLDTQRASMNLGTLSLHDVGVPLRLAGLGTRRLISLAIQQLSVTNGAIVLIDEIEHGLEPHRILHVLRLLKWMLTDEFALTQPNPLGQVLLTTHSAVTVIELSAANLHVARRGAGRHSVAQVPATVQPLLRRMPEAFLGRRIIVCEGRTEVGLLRAMCVYWIGRHEGIPPEHCGAVFVDGGGSKAQGIALALRQLGYDVLLFRDSDVPLTPASRQQLQQIVVPIVAYAGEVSTEHRLIGDLPMAGLGTLVAILYELHSADEVTAMVARELGQTRAMPEDFTQWTAIAGTEAAVRTALADVAKRAKWMKTIDAGERIGEVLVAELAQPLQAPITDTMAEIERWIYA